MYFFTYFREMRSRDPKYGAQQKSRTAQPPPVTRSPSQNKAAGPQLNSDTLKERMQRSPSLQRRAGRTIALQPPADTLPPLIPSNLKSDKTDSRPLEEQRRREKASEIPPRRILPARTADQFLSVQDSKSYPRGGPPPTGADRLSTITASSIGAVSVAPSKVTKSKRASAVSVAPTVGTMTSERSRQT